MAKVNSGPQNKRTGSSFEDVFFRQAQLQGFLILQNHQEARFTYNGRLQPIKGELDFKMIKNGVTGFFDCKSFASDKFSFSAIEEHQAERSKLYNEWNVPSGFIVYFRQSNAVCFFSGTVINKKGPGSSFSQSDGLLLGSIFEFRLDGLFLSRSKK